VGFCNDEASDIEWSLLLHKQIKPTHCFFMPLVISIQLGESCGAI